MKNQEILAKINQIETNIQQIQTILQSWFKRIENYDSVLQVITEQTTEIKKIINQKKQPYENTKLN